MVEARAIRVAYADALRAFAILCVFLHHMFLQTLVIAKTPEAGWLGYWGVDCFFVLTGFLLCGPYLRAIAGGTTLPGWRAFAARRFLRIYPLYAVCLALSIADAWLHADRPTLLDAGAHALMLHGFSVPFVTQINGPLWTMAVDAQFYVLMPLVLFALARAVRRWSPESRVRAVWLFLAAVCVLSALERFVSLYVLTRAGAATWDADAVYARNVLGMGTNFAIGAALAFLAVRRPVPNRPRAWYGAAIALGVALVGLQSASLGAHTTRGMWAVATYGLVDIIGACSAGLLLYGLTRGRWTAIDGPVSSAFVAALAALAYAVYLVQEPIIDHVVGAYHGALGNPLVTVVLGTAALAVVLIFAIPLHRFVEQPFLDMRDRHREAAPTLP